MADLHDARILICDSNQVVGFGCAGRDWFLYQNVDAGAKQRGCDRVVKRSGYANRGGVDADFVSAPGREHFVHRKEDRNGPFASEGSGSRAVRFDNCAEFDGLPGVLQLMINAKMIATEGSCSADGDVQREWITCHSRKLF